MTNPIDEAIAYLNKEKIWTGRDGRRTLLLSLLAGDSPDVPAAFEYVDHPGNWSTFDGRRAHLLGLLHEARNQAAAAAEPKLDPKPWLYALMGPAKGGFTPARSAIQETGGFIFDPAPGFSRDESLYPHRAPTVLKAVPSESPSGDTEPSIAELHTRYPEVTPFTEQRLRELWSNREKGDQPSWLTFSMRDAWAEISWHTAKLANAIKTNDVPLMHELTADIANCALMLDDIVNKATAAAAEANVA